MTLAVWAVFYVSDGDHILGGNLWQDTSVTASSVAIRLPTTIPPP